MTAVGANRTMQAYTASLHSWHTIHAQEHLGFCMSFLPQVFAIGNPFGLDHSLSSGIISGLNRELNTGASWRAERLRAGLTRGRAMLSWNTSTQAVDQSLACNATPLAPLFPPTGYGGSSLRNVIQCDAAINPGNSGGRLHRLANTVNQTDGPYWLCSSWVVDLWGACIFEARPLQPKCAPYPLLQVARCWTAAAGSLVSMAGCSWCG